MAAPSETEDTLWWLAAPIAVWTAHFGATYALVAVGCPYVRPELVYAGVAVATVLTGAPLAVLTWRGWRRYRRVAAATPDEATPEARHRFLALAGLLLAALGLVAVVYDVVGIALVGGCP